MPHQAIDYSDIPELDDDFWAEARLVLPETKERGKKTESENG